MLKWDIKTGIKTFNNYLLNNSCLSKPRKSSAVATTTASKAKQATTTNAITIALFSSEGQHQNILIQYSK